MEEATPRTASMSPIYPHDNLHSKFKVSSNDCDSIYSNNSGSDDTVNRSTWDDSFSGLNAMGGYWESLINVELFHFYPVA